jgi:hypothetical protein
MRVGLDLNPGAPSGTETELALPTGTQTWRVIMLLGWVGGVLGYSTVWAVSRQIGLPTWWLGPRSQPNPIYIVSLPFVLPVLMLLAISFNLKRLPIYGVLAACGSFVIAAGDAQTQPGLAIIQVAISIGLLCTSLAALIGTAGSRSANRRKRLPAR